MVRIKGSVTPLGVVTGVEGKVAHIWTFPLAIFGDKEIDIDFSTRKEPLQLGTWCRLKLDSDTVYRYKILSGGQQPMETSVSQKGAVEIKGKVVFPRLPEDGVSDKWSICQAWSPDFGTVGAFLDRSFYCEDIVYEATLKRLTTSQRQQCGNLYDWAILRNRPIEQLTRFEPLSGIPVPLKDRRAIHDAIIVEEQEDMFMVWSRSGELAQIPKIYCCNSGLKKAQWITYKYRLTCCAEQIPVITGFSNAKIDVKSVCINGIPMVSFSSDLLHNILHCQLLGTVQSPNAWAKWDGYGWTLCTTPEISCEGRRSISSVATAESGLGSLSQAICAQRCVSTDINLCDSDLKGSVVVNGVIVRHNNCEDLVVCGLINCDTVIIHSTIYADGTDVRLGDWVSVQAKRHSVIGHLIAVGYLKKINPIIPSRIDSNGNVYLQTYLRNVRVDDCGTFGYSDDLGKVRDLCEEIPQEHHPKTVFLVWCKRAWGRCSDCNWVLVKGEPVLPIYASEKYEAIQHLKQPMEPGGRTTIENSAHSSSQCRVVTKEEFIASSRRIFGNPAVQAAVAKKAPHLLLKMQKLMNIS